MSILAIIPARKGSKQLPKKNLAKIEGKSLVEIAINVAKDVKKINNILVSSDCKEILKIAKKNKVLTSLRPKELASDNSLIIETIKYEYERLKNHLNIDIIVLLEVTSPMRNSTHIEKCINMLIKKKLDSVATFRESDIHPHKTWQIKNNEVPKTFLKNSNPWTPRQELSRAYQLSGVAYVFKPDGIKKKSNSLLFGKQGGVIIDKKYSIDIDDNIDLELAKILIQKN